MGKPAIENSHAFNAIMDKVMLPYQRADVMRPDRFCWNNWSRQTGKSFSKTFRRIIRGVARKRNQFFLSAGERQSRELMVKVRQHCEALKIAFGEDEKTVGVFEGVEIKQLEVHLRSVGIRILGLPANPMTARGFTGDVLLDEFGMHRYDREIWAAMFPSIMRGEGELDISSTPKGKQNLFYELKHNDQYAHDTVTIYDAVAQGLDVDVEALRLAIGDEELFRQEFLCEFIDEATAFLTLDLIRACENPDLPYELDLDELESLTRGDIVIGIDIGRKHDLTAVWAFEQIGSQLISRGLLELKNMSFGAQREVMERILDARCVRRVCIDATGLGMQLAEELQQRFGDYRVEAITFTALMKEQMAGKLRARMEEGRVDLPAHKQIRDDLHSVEKSVTIDGRVRLRASRTGGSHADRFWALALAVWASADDTGPVEGIVGEPLAAVGIRDW